MTSNEYALLTVKSINENAFAIITNKSKHLALNFWYMYPALKEPTEVKTDWAIDMYSDWVTYLEWGR